MDTYSHVMPALQREAASKLDALLRPSVAPLHADQDRDGEDEGLLVGVPLGPVGLEAGLAVILAVRPASRRAGLGLPTVPPSSKCSDAPP